MQMRMVLSAVVASVAIGAALAGVFAQQQPLPPAGGGPAAAAAFAAYETPWDKLPQGERGPGVPNFYVRQGYRVDVASDAIPNGQRQGRNGPAANEARFMAMDDNGTLFVSQPIHAVDGAGQIVALQDKTKSGKYEVVGTFITGKHDVHGMYFKDGWLWFTTSTAVYKSKVTKDGKPDGDIITVLDKLPGGGGHWWRPILVADDGFYTGMGDQDNASDMANTDREKIWKYSLDGKTRTLWCSGIRNTEKLQFRPGTTEVWGCDHGSDNFGGNLKETAGKNQPVTDTYPPDEFNHYVKDGFYGHPFVVGDRIPRPEYANRPDILTLAANTIAPAWDVGPHYANCGWCFATKDTGVAHKGDALIACHGSWNATVKRGYRIQKVCFDAITGVPFGAVQLVGTLSPDHNNVMGRPVDVLELPDGSFLFSDDQNNKIFRLSAVKGQTEPK